jgi:hypothetical protein
MSLKIKFLWARKIAKKMFHSNRNFRIELTNESFKKFTANERNFHFGSIKKVFFTAKAASYEKEEK